MSNKFELRVAELMCSRLCHDLISPIGAINNGVELLNDGDNRVLQDSLVIIENSARQAVDRLSFFRISFGAGGEREMFLWKEIEIPMQKFAAEKGINIIWINLLIQIIIILNCFGNCQTRLNRYFMFGGGASI